MPQDIRHLDVSVISDVHLATLASKVKPLQMEKNVQIHFGRTGSCKLSVKVPHDLVHTGRILY